MKKIIVFVVALFSLSSLNGQSILGYDFKNGSINYNENWTIVSHKESNLDGGQQGWMTSVAANSSSRDILYAGSKRGGLWKTGNATANKPIWENLTDGIPAPVYGVKDVVVDPLDPNVLFITSVGETAGLGYGGSPVGLGVLRSEDGGNSWQETQGLTFVIRDNDHGHHKDFYPHTIFISPIAPSGTPSQPLGKSPFIFVLNGEGIWRSDDGGNNFSMKKSFPDMHLKNIICSHAHNNTLFLSMEDRDEDKAEVWRSLDNGNTWTSVFSTTDLVNKESRALVVTSKAKPSEIAIVYQDINGRYLIRSSNQGNTWSSPQSFNNSRNAFPSTLAMSDISADIFYVGIRSGFTQDFFYSFDGGVNFSNKYALGLVAPKDTMHADVNDIHVSAGSNINQEFVSVAHDGGVSQMEFNYSLNNGVVSLSSVQHNLKNGIDLVTTEVYGFDLDDENQWLVYGCQDIGTHSKLDGIYKKIGGGDGANVSMVPTMDRVFAGVNQSGLKGYERLNNNVTTVRELTHYNENHLNRYVADSKGNLFIGNFYKLFAIPKNANYIQHSFPQIFPNIYFVHATETFDFSSIAGGNHLDAIGLSKSNSDYMYVGFRAGGSSDGSKRLFKCTNFTSSNPVLQASDWEDIGKNSILPLNSHGIYEIVVNPYNENELWVNCGSGLNDLSVTNPARIYYSSDGGASWVPINNGLQMQTSNGPKALPYEVKAMIYDELTGGLYIGTDIGVYYNSNPTDSNSNWECFNKSLPIAMVTQLRIDQCRRKILASTFGRGIWESNLAEGCSHTMNATTNLLNIPTNEIETVYTNIVIPSGTIMTINGVLQMAGGTSITVKAGGKIVLDGGTITGLCGPWKGIRVEGNSLERPTNISAHGLLELKNGALIEHAENAVSLIGLDANCNIDWSSTGGQINASNATFRNNKRDVEFMSYNPPRPIIGGVYRSNSVFDNCVFETRDDSKFSRAETKTHITMWDVNGIRFHSCTFRDLRTTVNPIVEQLEDGRIGIHAVQSTFTIDNNCPIAQPSRFIGLKRGVEAFGNGKVDIIKIAGSEFNSATGIYFMEVNQAIVDDNKFTVNSRTNSPNASQYDVYGLYVDFDSKQYRISNNTFTGDIGSSGSFLIDNAGLVIRHTGAYNNEFNNNSFDDLSVGAELLGENRSGLIDEGLRFRCNNFKNHDDGIYILEDVAFPGRWTGIAREQGGHTNTPADNEFDKSFTNVTNHINNEGSPIDYLYRGSNAISNIFYPDKLTGPINTDNTGFANSTTKQCSYPIYSNCNSSGTGIGTLTTIGYNKKGDLQFAHNTYKATVDGGDTEIFLTDIGNINGTTVSIVYGNAITWAPNLSEESLLAIAQSNMPMTNQMITDIMVACPHSSRSAQIMAALNNRQNPLSPAMMQNIQAQSGVYTSFDNLIDDLTQKKYDYDQAASDVLFALKHDGNSTIADMVPWYEHPTNVGYYYTLAEMYFDDNNWNKFIETCNNIPGTFSNYEYDQGYHTTFINFYTQLQAWKIAGPSLFQPDASRLSWLQNFVQTNPNYPARLLSMLAVYDQYLYDHNVYLAGSSSSRPSIFKDDIHVTQDKLDLYPNPTEGIIILSWIDGKKHKSSEVTLFSIDGRKLAQSIWNGNEKYQMDISNLKTGNYFVCIQEVGEKRICRKVSLAHRN